MINKFLTVLFICLTFSCSAADRNGDDSVKKASKNEEILKEILKAHRSGTKSFSAEEKRLAKDLYLALYGIRTDKDIEDINDSLNSGANPNFCIGEQGWVDSNPLNVLSESIYYTFNKKKEEVVDFNLARDVIAMKLLLEAGADVKRRPYIWNRVYVIDNKFLKRIKLREKKRNPNFSINEQNKVIENYMKDFNRLIEAFLEAGADPDMLGHPYPYSREAMEARITDEEAREYFKKGTRAINVAIEKGIAWESQVDLLLKYTTLDEESLKAAERSNDPLMIEKINKLWESK